MNNKIVAIFAVALIAFGGIGFTVAMPEDVEYMDTPAERAAEVIADLADQKAGYERAYVAGQITKYQLVTRMGALDAKAQARIDSYIKMHDFLSTQIWSTDEGMVLVGNSSWSGRTGVSVGYDEVVVVVPYMQRQVDAKVAELEADEYIKNIDVGIVVIRTMYTYPGGPIFKLYHFEVTWDIYEELYN